MKSKLIFIAGLSLLAVSGCRLFPEKTTVDHLKRMDRHVLEDLFYLGSTKSKHYFRNDAYGYQAFFWVPCEDLEISNPYPLRRNGRGAPAKIVEKNFPVTVRASNIRKPHVFYLKYIERSTSGNRSAPTDKK